MKSWTGPLILLLALALHPADAAAQYLSNRCNSEPSPLKMTFTYDYTPEKNLTGPEKTNEGFKRKKKPGRAALEFFSLLAYSQTKYWLTYSDWQEDWRYRLTWGDQKKRIFGFSAWRFDSNCFGLNWSHALAGTLYYNFARTNNLSVFESFLFTTAGSMYWEYVVEWRNVISINDNIFSAFGGVSTGESWFQLGKFFAGRKGILNQILSFVNPILKFNNWLDRKETKKRSPDPGWHDFSISLGSRSTRIPSAPHRSGFFGSIHTQIMGIPEYGAPGEVQRTVHSTLFSEIDIDFLVGSQGIEEIQLFARAVLQGFYKKKLNAFSRGYEFSLGWGSAFTYFRKKGSAFYDSCDVKVKRGHDLRLEEPRDFKDKFSIIHIVGPYFDLIARSDRLKVRLTLDGYFDFSLVNAFALNTYSLDHGLLGIKTTALYYGYYYAVGASLFSGLSLEYRHFRVHSQLKYHYFNSVDGRDRFQDELTLDFNIVDSRLSFLTSLFIRLPGTPFELQAFMERINRRGRIEDTYRREYESRYFLGLNFRF